MQKTPSVTEVIQFSNQGAFNGIRPDVLENAKIRGTFVHEICSAYVQNLWIPEIPTEYQGYFDSFRKWFDHAVVQVVCAEKQLVHPRWRYHGTPDFIGQIKGHESLTLIDWKTPVMPSKGWALQVAGGYYPLSLVNDYDVIDCGILQLDQTGKKGKFSAYANIVNLHTIFLSVLATWRYWNE